MQRSAFRILGACVLSIALAQGVFAAEKEGAFVGAELGANQVKFKQTLSTPMMAGDIKADSFLPSLAVKGGYKWFFTEDFGVRAYGQVGVGYGRLNGVKYSDSLAGVSQLIPNYHNSVFTGTGKGYYTTFIDYFVGADLLYNFIQTQDMIWGVYGGVGLGGVTWIANGKEYEVSNGKRTYLGFAANANVGLRATLKEKHGFELGARFYFPKSEIFKANNGTSPLMAAVPVSETKTTHYRPFSVILSYIYSF